MFQNALSQKSCVLKCKEFIQNVRQVSRTFVNVKALLINITVGNAKNDSNYPRLTNHKIH